MLFRKKMYSNINIILGAMVFILTICGTGNNYAYPVIKLNVLEIGYSLLILLILLLIVNKKKNSIKYDSIACILFFRVIYYTIIVVSYQDNDYLALYLAVILGFIAYITAININITQKHILKISEAIIIISGLQTSLAVIQALSKGIPMYMVKSQIVTPIGASNMLAVIWNFMFPIIYKLEQSKIKKNFFFILIVALILLSRSNTGIIMLIIGILIVLFSEKNYKWIKILCVAFGAYLVVLFVSHNTTGYFDRVNSSFENIFFGNSKDIEQTFNGRIEIYQIALTLIQEKPIFGYSFLYRNLMPENMMAHNWILESLLSGGTIGLFFQIISYFLVFSKLIKGSKERNLNTTLLIAIIITLVQGLFEPSLGGMIFDLLFWLFIGTGINETQKNIKKEK